MELLLILIVFVMVALFLFRRRMYLFLSSLLALGGWFGCMLFVAVNMTYHSHFINFEGLVSPEFCRECQLLDRMEILADVMLVIAAVLLVPAMIQLARKLIRSFRERKK